MGAGSRRGGGAVLQRLRSPCSVTSERQRRAHGGCVCCCRAPSHRTTASARKVSSGSLRGGSKASEAACVRGAPRPFPRHLRCCCDSCMPLRSVHAPPTHPDTSMNVTNTGSSPLPGMRHHGVPAPSCPAQLLQSRAQLGQGPACKTPHQRQRHSQADYGPNLLTQPPAPAPDSPEARILPFMVSQGVHRGLQQAGEVHCGCPLPRCKQPTGICRPHCEQEKR